MFKSNIITLDVSLVKLIADAELTQVRVAGSAAHRDALVASLKADLEENPEARFRPLKVVRATDFESEFFTEAFYLVDGFHRFHAYKALGITEYPVDVVSEGDSHEAIRCALPANSEHDLALASNEDDEKKRCLKAAEWLKENQIREGRSFHNVLVKCPDIADLIGKSPRNGYVRNAAASINEEPRKVRDALIIELLEAGELSHREIAKRVGCDHKTVSHKKETLGEKVQPAQIPHSEPEEDPLAEIASDFAFNPESFMSEVDALADEEFEPEIILTNDEDKYFEVKPLVNVEVETKKAYKTGDDRYSFKKEADQMVAAFPPEVQANSSFDSINSSFKEWSHKEAVFNYLQMKDHLPDQLQVGLKNLRKMLSALEEAGISLPQ